MCKYWSRDFAVVVASRLWPGRVPLGARRFSPKRRDWLWGSPTFLFNGYWVRLKCDGTRAETRFRLSAKRTSTFKSAGASVQSTTGSRGVRISGNNAGYTILRGSVQSTGYPLHSPVSPSLPLPWVTVCHHISAGVYLFLCVQRCSVYPTEHLMWSLKRPVS